MLRQVFSVLVKLYLIVKELTACSCGVWKAVIVAIPARLLECTGCSLFDAGYVRAKQVSSDSL